MKKNGIGLLSAFTIVMALATAFTTKSKSIGFANDYEVWSIAPNAVSSSETNYVAIDAQKVTKLYDGGASQPVGADNATKLAQAISNYNATHNPDFDCFVEIGIMCVAYLNRGVGSTSVLATDDGRPRF